MTRTGQRGSAFRWGVGLLVLATGFVVAAIPPSPAAEAEPQATDFATVALESAADLVVDGNAGLVYVSQFATKEIKVIDLATAEVVETFALYGKPVGLELSADGADLYVALYNKGRVIVLDAATGTARRNYDVTAELGTPYTWALHRVGTKLYVAGTAVGNDEPHLAEVDLLLHAARRVGGEETTNSRPSFSWDGADVLYVGDADRRIAALDLTDPTAPPAVRWSALRDGRSAATPNAVLTDRGEVLDPADLRTVQASIEVGYPGRSESGDRLFVAEKPVPWFDEPDGLIRVSEYDSVSFERTVTMMTRCPIADVIGFEVLPNVGGFVILGESSLCVVPPLSGEIANCGGRRPTFVGTAGDDQIAGTDEADVIVGLEGNDQIKGLLGDDVLCGGVGNDILIGSLGDDRLFGGAGSDMLGASNGNDILNGGKGPDTARFDDRSSGTPFDHVEVDLEAGIATGLGNDVLIAIENILGSLGNDVLLGDSGRNVIDGNNGRNVIRGRSGDDHLIGAHFVDDVAGNGGDDILEGGRGDDRLSGGYGTDILIGGAGNDIADFSYSPGPVSVDLTTQTVIGIVDESLEGIESVIGTRFDDTLVGDDAYNDFWGSEGDDTIYGGYQADMIDGGPGNDTLFGEGGSDQIYGRAGRDVISGGASGDEILGGSKADTIFGGDYPDQIDGGSGADKIMGESGDDLLLGGSGNDKLYGGEGVDTILGQGGDDLIDGGSNIDAASYELAKGPIVASLVTNTGTGEGRDTFVDLDALIGSAAGDTLTGDGGVNIIIGLGGPDTLRGQGDPDGVYGDAGNDKL